MEIVRRIDVEKEDRDTAFVGSVNIACRDGRLIDSSIERTIAIGCYFDAIVDNRHDRAIDIEAEVIIEADLELSSIGNIGRNSG